MPAVRNAIFHILTVAGVPWMLRSAKVNQLTVLCFHRISNEEDFFFRPIRPDDFEQLLRYLIKRYSIVGFKNINEKTSKPKLILSFDDGYYDFVENALPLLTKYDLTCNLNVVNACLNNNETIWTQVLDDIFNHLRDNSITNSNIVEKYSPTFAQCGSNWMRYYLNFFWKLLNTQKSERDIIVSELLSEYPTRQKYRMMNWNDAAHCIKNGVEIGSHTYTHDSMKTLLSDEDFDREIVKSISELEGKLNVKVNILALPNGQYNKNVLDYCLRNNLDYVLAADNRTTPMAMLKNKAALVERVLMANESVPEMILRGELFHTRLRSII